MGSLVALLTAWALWAQVHPDDPVRVVSEHASLEECREHADRMNPRSSLTPSRASPSAASTASSSRIRSYACPRATSRVHGDSEGLSASSYLAVD
jgi:hypothetical protein